MENSKVVTSDKIHQLECFKPREIFNINTHAMFQKEKVKDPLDSDDPSNDDEEDIEKLLIEHKDLVSQDLQSSKRENIRNSKIDLKAYKPGKSIDYNIKVLR